ncbi:MAG TPA: ornithine acetyltransferase, partial [Deltaproteobacteria bacterium]|nr:ornithine acetyltransferase [Deltaproteobacteria bacterium]
VLFNLAQMIVKDGEGATKWVEVRVIGAINDEEAKKIAFTVANSPLVKTAIHGCDANWGRIIAAVGRSDATIDPSGISIYFDDVWVVNEGISRGKDAEEAAEEVLKKDHFVMTIDLGLGTSHASVFTCDFSPEYVKINASYRT